MTELYTQSGDLFVPSDSHLGLKARKKIRNYSMKNKIMSICLESVFCDDSISVFLTFSLSFLFCLMLSHASLQHHKYTEHYESILLLPSWWQSKNALTYMWFFDGDGPLDFVGILLSKWEDPLRLVDVEQRRILTWSGFRGPLFPTIRLWDKEPITHSDLEGPVYLIIVARISPIISKRQNP